MLSIEVQGTRLEFEHSLVALSEWEAIHEKPFFQRPFDDPRTEAETFSYFECMLVSPRDRADLIKEMSQEDLTKLALYINAARSATTVNQIEDKPGPKENVTSELIYYWMISFKIPFQPCETWHLNRLMTLIRIFAVKNAPQKKMSKSAIANKYRELNERRRAALGTKG